MRLSVYGHVPHTQTDTSPTILGEGLEVMARAEVAALIREDDGPDGVLGGAHGGELSL